VIADREHHAPPKAIVEFASRLLLIAQLHEPALDQLLIGKATAVRKGAEVSHSSGA
jgi:hypothetical protein